MAELFLAVFSENSEGGEPANRRGAAGQLKNRHLVIENPLAILNLVNIPGQYSFALTLGVRGADFTMPHSLRFRLVSEEGKNVIDSGVMELPSVPLTDEPALPVALRRYDYAYRQCCL